MVDKIAKVVLLRWVAMLLMGSQVLYANELETPLPTLEFLEYLGEWQDDNGQLIDPLVFGQQDLPSNELDLDGEEQ